MAYKRWIVECDGEVETHATREKARASAAWHNRHPSNRDIRLHGPYTLGGATGIARIIDGWTLGRTEYQQCMSEHEIRDEERLLMDAYGTTSPWPRPAS